MTEHSFHGIDTSPGQTQEKVSPMSPEQNVTYVSERTVLADPSLSQKSKKHKQIQLIGRNARLIVFHAVFLHPKQIGGSLEAEMARTRVEKKLIDIRVKALKVPGSEEDGGGLRLVTKHGKTKS
jgi:hypothetical protein